MAVVGGVAVTVVHVVDVVSMLDRVVTAIGVVLAVVITLVHDVLTARGALVPVSVVLTMGVAVMEVIDVIVVAHLDVSTAGAVLMLVLPVGVVLGGGHGALLLGMWSRWVSTRSRRPISPTYASEKSDGA
jgi:hypothetical protein